MSSAVTRRQFLRSGAGAAIATAGLTIAQTAVAEHMDEPGDNISLEYDISMLEKYRPRLVFPTEAREKLIGLYGWVAKSQDYDTDVACYWCRYTHQEGWVGPDSHFGDTEPVQVEIDSETGDVTSVRASVYHWLKGEATKSTAAMYDSTHPHLRVIEPWHQYTAPRPADDGIFLDVEDLTEAFPKWLKSGLEDSLHVGSTTVPWRMRNRQHFWRDTGSFLGVSFSADATAVRALKQVGYDTEGSLEAQT